MINPETAQVQISIQKPYNTRTCTMLGHGGTMGER